MSDNEPTYEQLRQRRIVEDMGRLNSWRRQYLHSLRRLPDNAPEMDEVRRQLSEVDNELGQMREDWCEEQNARNGFFMRGTSIHDDGGIGGPLGDWGQVFP